jgi:hypothetical protein
MKVAKALASIAALAVDTAPLIYYLELNATYLSRLDVVFNEIGQGHIQVYTASITLTEVLTKPIRDGNQQLQRSYRNLLIATNNITLISINPTIAERAAHAIT